MPANPPFEGEGSFAGRRSAAETYYELEMMAVEANWGRGPFVYGEERDLFRCPDAVLAFSRENVNVGTLVASGHWEGPTPEEAARLSGGG